MTIERALMSAPKYATGPTVIGQAYGGGYYAGNLLQGMVLLVIIDCCSESNR
jgi:hypothetical protein